MVDVKHSLSTADMDWSHVMYVVSISERGRPANWLMMALMWTASVDMRKTNQVATITIVKLTNNSNETEISNNRQHHISCVCLLLSVQNATLTSYARLKFLLFRKQEFGLMTAVELSISYWWLTSGGWHDHSTTVCAVAVCVTRLDHNITYKLLSPAC